MHVSKRLRIRSVAHFATSLSAVLLILADLPFLSLPAAFVAVLSSRYLFFVSVVPLNMALTFVRSVHA